MSFPKGWSKYNKVKFDESEKNKNGEYCKTGYIEIPEIKQNGGDIRIDLFYPGKCASAALLNTMAENFKNPELFYHVGEQESCKNI